MGLDCDGGSREAKRRAVDRVRPSARTEVDGNSNVAAANVDGGGGASQSPERNPEKEAVVQRKGAYEKTSQGFPSTVPSSVFTTRQKKGNVVENSPDYRVRTCRTNRHNNTCQGMRSVSFSITHTFAVQHRVGASQRISKRNNHQDAKNCSQRPSGRRPP